MEGSARVRSQTVQALRAVAALLVVGVHIYAVEAHYLPGRPWMNAFHIGGQFGVDLFFAISGAIMVITTWDAFGSTQSARDFFRRRVTRIYPPYWIATLPFLAIDLVKPTWLNPHAHARPSILASLLILPQRGEPLLLVGWTLVYEMLFYIVFALALLGPRARLGLVIAAWLVVVAAFAPFVTAGPWQRVLGSPLNLEFAFGVLAGVAFMRGVVIAPRALFLIAVVVFGTTFGVFANAGANAVDIGWWRPFAVGLPGAAIVYALLTLERTEALRVPAALRRIGDASYSLYLWHVPVVAGLGLIVWKLHNHAWYIHAGLIVASYVLAVLVALVVYARVERPLLRRLTRSKATSRASSTAQARVLG